MVYHKTISDYSRADVHNYAITNYELHQNFSML